MQSQKAILTTPRGDYRVAVSEKGEIGTLKVGTLILRSAVPLRWKSTEDAVKEYLRTQGYRVTKPKSRGKQLLRDEPVTDFMGRPDLLCIRGKERLWVEVKTGKDGFKRSQIEWVVRNPTEPVLLLYVIQDMGGDGEFW